VQALVGDWNPENHPALRRLNLRIPRRRQGRALLLGTKEAGNYYHWMLDCLPRWKLMAEAGFKDYDHVLLNTDTLRKSFCRDILDRLGVPVGKRLHCSTLFLHEFDELVVPSMPFPKWEVAAWACEWVSSLFTERNAHSPERIYISRRSAKKRRLVNEAELESQLAARGFQVVQAELLPVAGQSALFRRARCVVAPHGAGLTNLIFSPKGTQFIELFPPQYKKPPCFQNLASACSLGYTRITGRAVNDSDYEMEIPEVLKTV
jgi:capsular polysaccharide biosynthesis protein